VPLKSERSGRDREEKEQVGKVFSGSGFMIVPQTVAGPGSILRVHNFFFIKKKWKKGSTPSHHSSVPLPPYHIGSNPLFRARDDAPNSGSAKKRGGGGGGRGNRREMQGQGMGRQGRLERCLPSEME